MAEKEASPEAEKTSSDEDSKKNKKKKLIIMGGAGLLLLIIIGVVAYFALGKSATPAPSPTEPGKEAATETKNSNVAPKVIYFNLDEFIVNLSKVGGQPSFLKMAITLELVDEASEEKIGLKMPVIRDTFQVYLRELRAEDLQGSAGIYRLREELLLRLNKLMYPTKINDILFREILVQ